MNSVTLQVMVWACRDTAAADALHSRLDARLHAATSHKAVLAQLPLLSTALEACGKLAERFPLLASTTVVPALRDFLLAPSPLLARLLHREDAALEPTASAAPVRVFS